MTSSNHLHRRRPFFLIFVSIIISASLVSGCGLSLGSLLSPTPTPAPPLTTKSQDLPLAKVLFQVIVPVGAPEGDIELELLDEVTGLALNPQRYAMTAQDSGYFMVEIPIPIGSVVKYRYIRQGKPLAVEYTAAGSQVRYRLMFVRGPEAVKDIVSAWTDFRYSGPSGRLMGQITETGTNEPIPNALVDAGGVQTISASDGTFLIEGLAPGTHKLVVYSMDGSFTPFQQGALIDANATTSAAVTVSPASTVKVTFIAQIPQTNIQGLPLRMVGNITSLGNTFADLEGGMSIIASRAPLMTMISDDIYSLTLTLPVGLDLRYKYSLGDGFWNAEHSTDGLFRVRQLIVPVSDVTITDIIDTWQAGDFGPVTISVKVPDNTPPDDIVSIQFNPFGWTTPLPMWPLGNNQWIYVLYSPLNMLGETGYRFCRNDQCGSADDLATSGNSSAGLPFTPTQEGQYFQNEVRQWIWWETGLSPTTIIAPQIEPRGGNFIAGIEFSPHYSPTWQPYMGRGIQNAAQLGANWVLLSPSWHYTHLTPPVFEIVPGLDPSWADVAQSIQSVQQQGLSVGLFPRLMESQPGMVWIQPINDYNWWQSWYERYRVFTLNFADLAEMTHAPLLVIGGDDVLPAMPGGNALNGEPSGAPVDAADWWKQLIQDIRGRYSGQIYLALSNEQSLESVPEWIGKVDGIYMLFSAQLTNTQSVEEGQLEQALGDMLDREIYPIFENTARPVLIGIDYPSADGSAKACIQVNGACIDFDRLSRPLPDVQEVLVNLNEQVYIYGAAMNAVYQRDWISGFISRGYYAPAALQDKSSSVHGKPAADILWYWYPKLLGR